MDCSPPDSSVHGILQIRILEWRAILFSRGSFQPRDRTLVSYIAARFFTVWATQVASYIRPFHFPLKSYIFNVLPCIFHPFFFFHDPSLWSFFRIIFQFIILLFCCMLQGILNHIYYFFCFDSYLIIFREHTNDIPFFHFLWAFQSYF